MRHRSASRRTLTSDARRTRPAMGSRDGRRLRIHDHVAVPVAGLLPNLIFGWQCINRDGCAL